MRSSVTDKKTIRGALVLGALGVVFGDIGTSPLYALQECFAHGLSPEPNAIFGVLSLIFWGLMLIVSIKYVFVVMRASNRGEGGILALTALAAGGAKKMSQNSSWIAIIGLCGAALFMGDSMITPAISVLSAVEGLKIVAPSLDAVILPITAVILLVLFIMQRQGSQSVGNYFGPIMVVWFTTIALLGIKGIIADPRVLNALNPYYAFLFLQQYSALGFTVLGSVLLAFTGAEALYADMGHFGCGAIRCAWFGLVFPALILNYFGQGALLLQNPAAASNPFYLLAPDSLLIPMVVLAALATVIASQAVISGAFSIAQQAMQLDYLPRLTVRHTSASEYGQIYVPQMNWILCVGVLLLVVLFRSSSALANAYGFAVMGTMLTTTILVYTVARHVWKWSRLATLLVVVPLMIVDVTFFSTAIAKVPEGGWLPLSIGIAVFIIFTTWHQGREIVRARRRHSSKKLETFIDGLKPDHPVRVPGTAIFLSSMRAIVPPVLLSNLRHNKVLHQQVIMLTIVTEEEPRVADAQRITIRELQHGFWQVVLHYGFMERPHVMQDLQTHLLNHCPIEAANTSFFIGHDVFVAGQHPLKPAWREQLFLWLSNHATSAFEYFQIPTERVVELGIQIEV